MSSTLTAADVGGAMAITVKVTGPGKPLKVAWIVWLEPPTESVTLTVTWNEPVLGPAGVMFSVVPVTVTVAGGGVALTSRLGLA